MEDDEVDEAERLLSMVQDEIDFEREEEKELAKARNATRGCGSDTVVLLDGEEDVHLIDMTHED